VVKINKNHTKSVYH